VRFRVAWKEVVMSQLQCPLLRLVSLELREGGAVEGWQELCPVHLWGESWQGQDRAPPKVPPSPWGARLGLEQQELRQGRTLSGGQLHSFRAGYSSSSLGGDFTGHLRYLAPHRCVWLV
jgi:hypothetical protein